VRRHPNLIANPNAARLTLLEQQASDLADCLGALLAQVADGTRPLQTLPPDEMYTIRKLNPVVYQRAGQHNPS